MKQIVRLVRGLPFFFLAASTLLFPLYYIGEIQQPWAIGKLLMLSGLLFCSCVFLVVRIMVTNTFERRTSIVHVGLYVLAAAAMLSTLLSTGPVESLFGHVGVSQLTGWMMIVVLCYAWLTIQEVRTIQQFHVMLGMWLVGSTIAGLQYIIFSYAVFSPIREMLAMPAVPQSLVSARDSVTAVYFVVVALVGMGLLMRRAQHWTVRFVPVVAVVTSLTVVLAQNISTAFVFLCIGAFLLSVWAYVDAPRMRFWWVGCTAAVFFLSMYFFFVGTPRPFRVASLPEVTLQTGVSIDTAEAFLASSVKHFFFGVGPGLFDVALYQTATAEELRSIQELTIQQLQPSSIMVSIAVEYGFIVFVIVIAISLLGAGTLLHGMYGVYRAQAKSMKVFGRRIGEEHEYKDAIVLAIAWVIVSVSLWTQPYDSALLILWCMLLGLFVVGFSHYIPDSVRTSVHKVTLTQQSKMMVLFAAVGVFVGGAIAGSYALRYVQADRLYVQATGQGFEQATVSLEKAIALRPGYPLYHQAVAGQYALIAGGTQFRQENQQQARALAAAIDHGVTAAEAMPYRQAPLLRLASYYRLARELAPEANAKAAALYEQAVALTPNDPGAHWGRGDIAFFAEEYDDATKAFEAAIAVDPTFVPAYHALAQVALAQENINGAIATYDEMIDAGIDPIEAQYEKGRVLFNQGSSHQVDQARVVWESLLEVEPSHVNAKYSLGLLYQQIGERTRAERYFAELVKQFPENEDLRQKLNSL